METKENLLLIDWPAKAKFAAAKPFLQRHVQRRQEQWKGEQETRLRRPALP